MLLFCWYNSLHCRFVCFFFIIGQVVWTASSWGERLKNTLKKKKVGLWKKESCDCAEAATPAGDMQQNVRVRLHRYSSTLAFSDAANWLVSPDTIWFTELTSDLWKTVVVVKSTLCVNFLTYEDYVTTATFVLGMVARQIQRLPWTISLLSFVDIPIQQHGEAV